MKNNGEIWTCFDDKLVYNIDIVKLKQFAFGMDNNNDGDFIFENNRNAYLLFYIKKNNINCENFVNINSINLIKKNTLNNNKDNISIKESTYFDEIEVNKMNNSELYFNKDNEMDIDNADNSSENNLSEKNSEIIEENYQHNNNCLLTFNYNIFIEKFSELNLNKKNIKNDFISKNINNNDTQNSIDLQNDNTVISVVMFGTPYCKIFRKIRHVHKVLFLLLV